MVDLVAGRSLGRGQAPVVVNGYRMPPELIAQLGKEGMLIVVRVATVFYLKPLGVATKGSYIVD